MARHSAELLFAGDANYDRRNIFHIDKGVEIFRAGQIRKVDDTVSHLGGFCRPFFLPIASATRQIAPLP
jgi:hypothetical protein